MVYTIPFQPSDYSVICAAAFGPLGPVHMCLLMCLVPLPLFNQFIMLSVGLYSRRSGPSTLILTRLDKASCFMLVLAVILILLTELKPLSHSAVVSEIVSISFSSESPPPWRQNYLMSPCFDMFCRLLLISK